MTGVPQDIARAIDALRPLPVTVLELIRLGQDREATAEAAARILLRDPVLTGRVLAYANSALAGPLTARDSVANAVVRLGWHSLTNLAMSELLRDQAVDVPAFDLDRHELWVHGATSSTAVTLMMHRRGHRIPPLAPVAALLHDVGKVVMCDLASDVHDRICERATLGDIGFTTAEREVLGYDHAQVGALVCEHWKLPPEVCGAVRDHHVASNPQPTPMLDAVIAANFLAKTVGTGLGAEGMRLDLDVDCVDRLGLSLDEFAAMCFDARSLVERMEAVVAA